MRIFFRSQEARFALHQRKLHAARLSFDESAEFPERTIENVISETGVDLRACDLDWFFRYDLFPQALLRSYGDWKTANRGMAAGDVIVLQAHMPPGRFNLKLLFGVRVLSVYRSAAAAGFRYGTLEGHPEKGTNEFSFTVDERGIVATIRTRAALALPISRLFAFAVKPFIAFSNRAALRRMREQFLRHNAAATPVR